MEKSNIIKNIERRIKEIAKDYESRGYSVVVSPNQSNLPEFLRGYEPDLIAESESESVVVEVKSTKGNTAQLKQYESLANVISEHKKWRFELVFTNPIEQTVEKANVTELSLDKIRQRLDEVKSLIELNYVEAAFLLAWTALEASFRLKLENKKSDSTNKPTLAVIKTVFSLGYINLHDYKKLERFNQRRNQLIHGFDNPIDKNSVNDLLNIVTYVIGDSKEVVMYNWLESLDLDEFEEVYQLHYTVRYKRDYGAFTYSENNDISIGCTYLDDKLHLADENEAKQFLSLIEQEYMDDMDAESWYGFKKAMEKDD